RSVQVALKPKGEFPMRWTPIVLSVALTSVATPARAQVVKESVPGIANFYRIESTVACASAITPEVIPQIKAMGYHSIINLRVATEPGAQIEESKAAAEKAGIAYFHIPYNITAPDPHLVDQFLKAITTPSMEPAFIHCAGGGRAAGMWAIKRALVDGWKPDR